MPLERSVRFQSACEPGGCILRLPIRNGFFSRLEHRCEMSGDMFPRMSSSSPRAVPSDSLTHLGLQDWISRRPVVIGLTYII